MALFVGHGLVVHCKVSKYQLDLQQGQDKHDSFF
jgi:hypothetical protein